MSKYGFVWFIKEVFEDPWEYLEPFFFMAMGFAAGTAFGIWLTIYVAKSAGEIP